MFLDKSFQEFKNEEFYTVTQEETDYLKKPGEIPEQLNYKNCEGIRAKPGFIPKDYHSKNGRRYLLDNLVTVINRRVL